MRAWLVLAWLAGLALAATASWLVWHRAGIEAQDLRFAATLAPVVAWGMLPVLFVHRFSGQGRSVETPKLRDQRRAALTFLANRGLKGHARYALPVYLVLGPAGAGKSSLLERSETGLGMPRPIGNTTWWVGQDAVFVEATSGLAEADMRDVVELLRSVRPKLPLNGTLLVISPADLTLADQTEHQMLAAAIAQTLRAVEAVGGGVAPVYLMLTKADLLPGFREFFDRQEPQERSHPWGFDLPFGGLNTPQSPGDRNRQIDDGFQRLLSAMRARHVEWLSREADPVRCGRIQGFAAHVAALRSAIRPILEALLPDQTQAWNGAVLRGVFLTSARQEPLSIDALLPELSRRFAMPRSGTLPPDLALDEEDQGYFIAGTLKQAILPEAGLALRERGHRVALPVQWAAVAVIVAAAFATVQFVFRDFDEEAGLAARLSDVGAGIEALANPSTPDKLGAVLGHLRHLDAIAAEIEGRPAPPDFAFGLSGRRDYAAALDAARRALRGNALVPHLAALMESQLVDPDRDQATLQRLIAVAEDADDPGSRAVLDWLQENAAVLAEDDRPLLMSEGLAALRQTGGLTIDPAYTEAARRMIAYRESRS
jgi:type VI protein secretion system component VasK